MIGESVNLPHPHKYGMVQMSNCSGIVTEELSCNYYRVEIKENDVKIYLTMYGSMLVPCNSHDSASASNSQRKVITITEFASILREDLLQSKSDDEPPNEDRQEVFRDLMKTIGVDMTSLQQPTNLVDIYCYSCDLRYIAVSTESNSFIQLCITNSKAIQSYLKQASFEYYLSGIHAWEQSRNANTSNLLSALQKSELPQFIGASHYCIDCINAMRPCKHECCKAFFFKAGKKCCYISDFQQDDEIQVISRPASSCTTITSMDIMPGQSRSSKRKRTSHFNISYKRTSKRKKCNASPGKQKRLTSLFVKGQTIKSSAISHSSDQSTIHTKRVCKHITKGNMAKSCKKQKSTSSVTLRGVASFNPYDLYKRTSLSSLPLSLSLRRLDAVREKLEEAVDPRMRSLTQKCNAHINNWTNLSSQEKNNLSVNM